MQWANNLIVSRVVKGYLLQCPHLAVVKQKCPGLVPTYLVLEPLWYSIRCSGKPGGRPYYPSEIKESAGLRSVRCLRPV